MDPRFIFVMILAGLICWTIYRQKQANNDQVQK